MPRVIVVGSANIDLTVAVERLPDPGETVLGGDLLISHGGKGANQAVAAHKAGASVTFVGRVGTDRHGDEVVNHLGRLGLGTQGLARDRQAPTGVALILVDGAGRNQIVVAPGGNRRLAPRDLEPHLESLGTGDVLLAQLEIPLETVEAALLAARRRGAVTILNPAPARGLPPPLVSAVDVLTPNEAEASALAGIPVSEPRSASEAGRRLVALGARWVVITLGAQGAVLVEEREALHFPPFPVRAIDSTAAGDAFNGALAAALAAGRRLGDAIPFANAAGALAATRRGAQESLPAAADIARLTSSPDAPRPVPLT